MIRKLQEFFEEHNRLSWFITIMIAVAIFILSSLVFGHSIKTGQPTLPPSIYHLSVFFFFTLFLLISLVKGRRKLGIFLTGIIISIIYAFSDEIHQIFVPGRLFTFTDIFLDTIGITLASLLYFVLIEYGRKKIQC